MPTRTRFALVLTACLAVLQVGVAQVTQAQTEQRAWPQRTVRFIIPFGPGAAADVAARILAERLQKVWDKPIVVENRPGGDGLVSLGVFVSAKDDHVLFVSPTSIFVVHPYTQDNLPYDVDRDLQPIAWIGNTLIGIAVTAKLQVGTLQDFVDYAKREAGKVNYGISPGFTEFIFDGFMREHGLSMAKVPFRDILQAPIDLGEGRIQILMTSFAAQRPQIESGKTRLLAIGEPKRSALAPGVPTVHEAGYPGLEATPINAMFGPRDMALELRRRVGADVVAALKDKDVVDRLRASGQQETGAGPDELAAAVAAQHAQVARIAKVLGVSKKK